DHHHIFAVLQHVAVRILYHRPSILRGHFIGVPFMAAFAAHPRGARGISDGRTAVGTGMLIAHGARKYPIAQEHASQKAAPTFGTMIRIGRIQELLILRKTSEGLILGDDDDQEVLLPKAEKVENDAIESPVRVFVYRD